MARKKPQTLRQFADDEIYAALLIAAVMGAITAYQLISLFQTIDEISGKMSRKITRRGFAAGYTRAVIDAEFRELAEEGADATDQAGDIRPDGDD